MILAMWSMTIMVERLYLTHFRRGDDICPYCFASLVWRCVGYRKYTPCDKQPVICFWDKSSKLRVVYRGEIVQGVRILTSNNAKDFLNKKTFTALQPHVFTCPAIQHAKALDGYSQLYKGR